MQILFITANRVGDAVLTTGVLAWLVKRYPEARFTIVCGPYAADLFRAVPRLDQLLIMQKQSWNRHWLNLWRECRGTRWDLIVDFRDSVVSRLLPAKQRAYRRHGTGQHKVIENAAILELAPPPAPQLWIDAASEAQAQRLLDDARPILALGPAANWAAKQWPAEYFADLAQRLISADGPLSGARVMVLSEERDCAAIKPLLDTLPDDQRIEIIGYDLLTVAASLKQAALFVGNDSGLMHIAAASGVLTLGLFGPGYEDIYGPWGERAAHVRTDISREKLLARLPADGPPPNLMESLSVEKVLAAARALLATYG